MPSIGVCSPNVAKESSLSQILGDVPEKYFLSSKACQGILRRAEAPRGQEAAGNVGTG